MLQKVSARGGDRRQATTDQVCRSQTTTQSDSIAQIAAQNKRILDAQQSDEFRNIVAWLAPPDPGTNHATARQHHESQTGGWLLKSTQYTDWKTSAVNHL